MRGRELYEYQARVLQVHDGDTVRLDIDLGLRTHRVEPIRLFGINAPELPTVAGVAAQQFLASLLPVGSIVTLKTMKDEQEKYGRWLGVIATAGVASVNATMIETGHAVAYYGRKDATK